MLERFLDWIDQSEVRSFIFYWVILFSLGYVVGFTLGIYLFKIALWLVVGSNIMSGKLVVGDCVHALRLS